MGPRTAIGRTPSFARMCQHLGWRPTPTAKSPRNLLPSLKDPGVVDTSHGWQTRTMLRARALQRRSMSRWLPIPPPIEGLNSLMPSVDDIMRSYVHLCIQDWKQVPGQLRRTLARCLPAGVIAENVHEAVESISRTYDHDDHSRLRFIPMPTERSKTGSFFFLPILHVSPSGDRVRSFELLLIRSSKHLHSLSIRRPKQRAARIQPHSALSDAAPQERPGAVLAAVDPPKLSGVPESGAGFPRNISLYGHRRPRAPRRWPAQGVPRRLSE